MCCKHLALVMAVPILPTSRKAAYAPIVCALALAVAATPSHADVLEVGDDGSAHWVAGPALDPAGELMLDAAYAPAVTEELPLDISIPAYAFADADAHAAVVPGAYQAKVLELARRFDISPALIEAVVWQESRWRAGAVSPKGARGLAQLMPGTARELGVDARDPFANLEGGARYLREQLDRFDGNIEKALAAYNAGPGRVEEANGIPNIRETRAYVAAIMGRLSNHSRSMN